MNQPVGAAHIIVPGCRRFLSPELCSFILLQSCSVEGRTGKGFSGGRKGGCMRADPPDTVLF